MATGRQAVSELWCRIFHGRYHVCKGVTAWGAVMTCTRCGAAHWGGRPWWWGKP